MKRSGLPPRQTVSRIHYPLSCFSFSPLPLLLGLLLVWSFTALTASAQDSGTVAGLVLNSWDGSPLVGATITMRGTTLATQSDGTGRFELKNVPPGDQVMRFSKSGFASAVVTDVRVLPGQSTTVNGNLRPEFYEMEEYEVTAEEFTEQTEQILIERQQSSSLLDAVGSDTFKNLAVSDAAGALSKVTGASVADGKYAVIRGLADRYTFTTMNGNELPSADPDRKAFQLDLMPAKFIEKLDVRKTFTPDMSGGFAGGAIDIVTKSFPENGLFEFRVGTAYNTQSSLRDDFASSDRSSTDWLAMDDGLRALPEEVAATDPSGSRSLPANLKGSFKSSQLTPVATDSPVDSAMNLLFGDTHKILGGLRLGYVGGLNYKNTYRFYDNGFVRSYQSRGTVTAIDKTDTRGLVEYQWSALANLSLELNEWNQLKFNFLYVQAAEDEARRLQGQDGDVTSVENGTYTDQSILHWTERNLQYLQLAGKHALPDFHDLGFDWAGSLSETSQDEPDYRIFQFLADPQNSNYDPTITSAQPSEPTRYWRALEENNANIRADLTVPVPSYNSKDNEIKLGGAISNSKREYAQRGYSMFTSFGHPFYSIGDPNIYLLETNLPYVDYRNFPVNLTYKGEQTINALYAMADWAALGWLELIGGARYETTDLSLTSYSLSARSPGASGKIKQDDLLPSLSAVVRLGESFDIRGAWSQTVIRPTYREIAPVPIYDVTKNTTIIGNTALKMSASENYDLRASWYLRPGEIVSLSLFAKKIEGPIELNSLRTDNSIVSYKNSQSADVYGVEGEFRMKLDRLWEPLDALTLGFNGAYIESEVPLTDVEQRNRRAFADTSTTRPLYDQPNYILNADLTWEIAKTRTTVTLSGGVVGERLVLVGLAKPDEFREPAPELNLFVRQRIGKNWDVRFTAKNLLNPEIKVAQTWPTTGKVILESHTEGITFGLAAGCEF
jgi:outer membrane receptor protein involved in Fe transport